MRSAAVGHLFGFVSPRLPRERGATWAAGPEEPDRDPLRISNRRPWRRRRPKGTGGGGEPALGAAGAHTWAARRTGRVPLALRVGARETHLAAGQTRHAAPGEVAGDRNLAAQSKQIGCKANAGSDFRAPQRCQCPKALSRCGREPGGAKYVPDNARPANGRGSRAIRSAGRRGRRPCGRCAAAGSQGQGSIPPPYRHPPP
jgi:hypothetical protein